MKHLRTYTTTVLLVVIAVIFIQSIDTTSYRNHHTRTAQEIQGEQKFLLEATVYPGPYHESWIIDLIDRAQNRVWVAVYTMTLPVMREALVRAHERGVDVRVVMEKFPFGNTRINADTEAFFQEHSLPFHLSTEEQFSFMHAKFSLIDSQWIVETANWTRASFSSNREFFITGHDEHILSALAGVFEPDFMGNIGVSDDMRLLAGPTNARARLTDFLQKTQTSVDIYAPNFSDEALMETLAEICRAGRSVRILLAYYDDSDENLPKYDRCLQVHFMTTPLHAKALIRDGRDVFVGSFNYTTNSLENNREVGLFLTGSSTNPLVKSFASDWQQSRVALK